MPAALESIIYKNGSLKILDQLQLPLKSEYVPINNCEDGHSAIRSMKIRGAPAIGVLGSLSLAVELKSLDFSSFQDLCAHVNFQLDYLVSARPTAVNMSDCRTKIQREISRDANRTAEDLKRDIVNVCEDFLPEDVITNQKIGENGAKQILEDLPDGRKDNKVCVLTHCNTGSLATAGYGTALGIVRSLHRCGRLQRCYCTETRPYNQGARLTAFELVAECIPGMLIADSMVGALMRQRRIDAVVVGADRIVRNGDTANKIGTYSLAILAQHHAIPFYVAAPSTTVDLSLASGEEIVIEERSADEMTSINGVQIAAPGIEVWNPAFDVTPASLIKAVVTEKGVFKPSEIDA